MVNIHEQFTIPFDDNEQDSGNQAELPEINPDDQDVENYEENLEAQHADADKILEDQKIKEMEEKHHREEREKLETIRRKHMEEDREELNKQYYK